MGKKRRMKANPAKYGKKYANHPIIRAWAESQATTPEVAEEVVAEPEVVAEVAPAPKKSAPAPAKKVVENKTPSKSAVKKTKKS